MQTTITIHDGLIEQAAKLANIQNRDELIELALNEFIEHHRVAPQQAKLSDLYGGAGGISEDYDYKILRNEDGKECI